MRRNFYELATPGPTPIAGEALKHIAEFYAIEKDIRGRSTEERRLVRQLTSSELMDTCSRLGEPGQVSDGRTSTSVIYGRLQAASG